MKFTPLILLCFATLTGLARSEPAQIGNQADFALTVLTSYGTHSGSTIGSNDITANLQLSGNWTCVPDGTAGNFDVCAADISSRIRKLVEADGWTVSLYQLKSIFLTRQLTVLARRNGVSLDLTAALFPMAAGRMGVAYTQGTK
jgi:hypothetical protein